jgi:flagellar biosynthesis/type III secretory pathway ATPase
MPEAIALPAPVDALLDTLATVPRLGGYGKVTRIVGLVIEAAGLDVGLGELCRVTALTGDRSVLAEVVGFHEKGVLLMPLGEIDGLHPGSAVRPARALLRRRRRAGAARAHPQRARAPDRRAGQARRRDARPALGRPAQPAGARDGGHADGDRGARHRRHADLRARAARGDLRRLGRRQVDAARDDRAAGQADVNVIALLGERGREVREFIEHSLGPKDGALGARRRHRRPGALVRARGALVATAIAEYFRDQGKHVLLMVDSVTRVAMAWREIGLAVGEPPTTKGYPPSVFAMLPRLLERAGNGERGGITGLYTVLVDGDDFNEPVADAARSILDGHVVLKRKLAAAGHFPAIDVLDSKSRVRDQIIAPQQKAAANLLLQMEAAYREKEDLILVGAYQKGSDPMVDAAIALRESSQAFLQQRPDEYSSIELTQGTLLHLAAQIDAARRRR